MTRILTFVFFSICLCGTVIAQGMPDAEEAQDVRDAKNAQMLKIAAKNGIKLPILGTVTDSVSASAVLIPRVDARRMFGKEIANNYAVIEINLGNKSSDAALIVHSVFIDYSNWALRGGPVNISAAPLTLTGMAGPSPYQTATNPDQVASAEYRVIRGQLQDARLWTARSWTMRLLTFAAGLASAYPFPLNARGVKELGVFSGTVVPGMEMVWPDSSEDQMNRISDYGFKSNKVIPKESSDIIICFFPIDRFLTPGLKELYKKSPALFFAPLQMFADKKIIGDVNRVIVKLTNDQVKPEIPKALQCYLSVTRTIATDRDELDYRLCLNEYDLREDRTDGHRQVTLKEGAYGPRVDAFRAINFFNNISLNSVRILVDGVMTVDTSSMAPKLEAFKLNDIGQCGEKGACYWTDSSIGTSALISGTGVRIGSVEGSYLTGGTVQIAEAKDLGIIDLQTLLPGSNDQKLNFVFKLTKPIPTGTKLHLSVTKPLTGAAAATSDAQSRQSPSLIITVPGPFIEDVKLAAPADQKTATLTLTGTDFASPPKVKIKGTVGDPVEIDVSKYFMKAKSTTSSVVFEIPSDTLSGQGCWNVVAVTADESEQPVGGGAGKSKFAVPPTIQSAKFSGKIITITGARLDRTDCSQHGLVFSLVDEKGNAIVNIDKSTEFKPDAGGKADSLTITSPKDIGDNWKLKVTFNGVLLEGSPVALTK